VRARVLALLAAIAMYAALAVAATWPLVRAPES
jgi:hypothetical protein